MPLAEEITSASLEALVEEDPDLKERLNSYIVGSYLKPEDDVVQVIDSSTVSSPLIDAERSLAYLLGVHAAGKSAFTNRDFPVCLSIYLSIDLSVFLSIYVYRSLYRVFCKSWLIRSWNLWWIEPLENHRKRKKLDSQKICAFCYLSRTFTYNNLTYRAMIKIDDNSSAVCTCT